ncbi:sigma-54-dependent Fis family transcriptional regulator [candidate division KSB1 bacterium]|nr:sigma-54-dependent Fis family transcriptional regulator [candidate division KSB1 bacterium]NIR71257.1 sigma-54-dependent Fis family transcriptional regulator [candidate division KSB1 bacterium]NIS24786.1 sigma-54-dependent Fis family transcriptional regulator [candidate division KSB1 bacterium]NIT71693.1 sigma-54-dependent Fis family transcriptional regulator [candidate division KSB1 bacterium]NIU25422.1 sigma-54-dependent Fis family transcriptional regulator [candidate division KSB1 bacteri
MKNIDPEKAQILTVSQNRDFVRRIRNLFPRKDFFVAWESSIDQLLKKFEVGTYDVVIITSSVCREKDAYNMKVVDDLTSRSPSTQFLTFVEPEDIDIAMAALKAGSYQYAKAPVRDDELQLLIESALENKDRLDANLVPKKIESEDKFENLVGSSTAMREVYTHIRQAAATEVPVLLLGETGTGKDLAAQAIHARGKRKDGPYIPVNLGALPSELVASELFGHEKGAFTGAVSQHKGKFEQAKRGTIFLDEIDTVVERIQVSLLRVIEQKKFVPLGGRRNITTDARLIVASNQDLESLVEAGSFRQDLFYRLDVFRIEMPPLRARHGDIPLLVKDFLARYNQAFNKNIAGISSEATQLLETYDWPGNVRELKNVIQRAALLCNKDTILPEHLPPRFVKSKSKRPTVTFEIGTPLDDVEREMIVRALAYAKNNRTHAAELLGISRRAIYNKINKHNID